MAVLKHIKSRNADYSAAIDYLLFQHDEKTGKRVVDELDRCILREEFYMDGLNCDPMSFDKECQITNARFHKNQKESEIKSHHYIISFDPKDVSECGLTGPKAQSLCLDLARKIFPGYQALIVTHTDGHNESGNIHTHIVINSVRKESVAREPYMSQPHDHEAGFKHRSTNKFLEYFKQNVMEMCAKEGLHQIDLLSPAEVKVNQAEYMAQQSGQRKLEKLNEQIIADGFQPTTTVFQTEKQELRTAIEACASTAKSFEEFQAQLLENYQISVIEHRGRYSYLHPARDKRITDKALGTRYGKINLEECFLKNRPFSILYIKSHLRLVVDLQTNIKAMQSPAYAHKVKISNLQQMAETVLFIQEHGYDTQNDLKLSISQLEKKMENLQIQQANLSSKRKALNSRIHYTGQYLANKNTYSEFLKSKNRGIFRKHHLNAIHAYEEARDWLKSFNSDEKILSIKELKEQKENLQEQLDSIHDQIFTIRNELKEMETANKNVDAILHMQVPSKEKTHEQEL